MTVRKHVTPDTRPASANDPWHLLRNRRAMTAAIAEVTACEPAAVRRLLWREFLWRGGTVRRAARELGVRRHRFDEKMAHLYSTSDAFLYELAVWNVNLLKRTMRAWTTSWITRVLGPGQRVLTWGDGLGFDTLSLAEAGHDVTYYEVPGSSFTFARKVFDLGRAPVRMVADAGDLRCGSHDAVVCLDVLEHVPDVPAELDRIRRCLRPGGVLVVHAPFYFVHRAAVTHLRCNRRYSGSLALFRRAGFRLVDAQPTWAPLIFARDDAKGPRRPWLALPRLALALPFGLYLSLGRVSAIPFEPIHLVTRLAQPWYAHDMICRGARAHGQAIVGGDGR